MKNVILLLTGTVKPGQMTLTKLQDANVRQAQYISTLNFWLDKTNLPIVFIENSGTDLSNSISGRYSDRVEFLTFDGNDYHKMLGKGVGELNCLEHAWAHSVRLRQCDFAFKITGRYQISNFRKFYTHYLKSEGLYVFADIKRSLKFADSRFFGFQPTFLSKYLVKYKSYLNDSEGRFFENILAKSILDAVIDDQMFEQFPYYPAVVGYSGTDNRPYRSSYHYLLAKQIQLYLKALLIKN